MAIKIKVDELKKNAVAINAKINELNDLNKRLNDLIERINSSWLGNAAELYVNLMRGHLERIKKMINVLTEYKKYVDNCVNEFSELDQNSANSLYSLL